MIYNVYWSTGKVLFIIVRFECNLNFLDRFSKNPQISNFMKIRSVGAELFHAGWRTDRQTDRHDNSDEDNSRFSQLFENA
jgi:hypothetical protein